MAERRRRARARRCGPCASRPGAQTPTPQCSTATARSSRATAGRLWTPSPRIRTAGFRQPRTASTSRNVRDIECSQRTSAASTTGSTSRWTSTCSSGCRSRASVRVHGCDPRNVRPPRQLEIGRQHPRGVPSRGSEVAPRCRPHGARERGARPSKRSRRVALGRTMAARVLGDDAPYAVGWSTPAPTSKRLGCSCSRNRSYGQFRTRRTRRCGDAPRRAGDRRVTASTSTTGSASLERRPMNSADDPRASDERSCRGRGRQVHGVGGTVALCAADGRPCRHARHGALGSEVADTRTSSACGS